MKFFVSILISLAVVFSCVKQEQTTNYPVLQISGKTMGTTYSIKYIDIRNSENQFNVKKEIDSLLVQINQQMSTYIDDSEISLFNSYPRTQWFTISPEVISVLKTANEVSKLTHGAFDVTIGPLVNLWGFGPKEVTTIPSERQIQRKLKEIGYQKLLFNQETSSVKKTNTNLYVDLSAIAKGYAVDVLSKHLDSKGIFDHMVEIGGELRVQGTKNNTPWVIGIESPNSENRTAKRLLKLKNMAIATSGDYRNYFEKEGTRFSHTIDPRTGSPITHALASVSVLDPSCERADALATAFMVLGPEDALKLANKKNIAAFFIVRTDGEFTVSTSKEFDRLTSEVKK